MNVVDLHPEELLDKQASGELTAHERLLLEAHLARCPTCRFELQLRADFADELGADDLPSLGRLAAVAAPEAKTGSEAAPAPRGTAAETKTTLSEENGEQADRAREEDVLEIERAARASIRPRRLHRWLLVAAALCVGGVAGAAGGVPVWRSLANDPARSAPEPAPAPPRGPARTEIPAPREAPPEREPEPSEPPAVSSAPILVTAAPPALSAPILVTARDQSAARLLDLASEARTRGDYPRFIALHEELVQRFPSSREAQVSHATVGRLRLDRGDAAGALASFEAYRTAGGGDLDESVLVGRARALERLGRRDEERAAWQSLLASYPSTPWAEHARERLEP